MSSFNEATVTAVADGIVSKFLQGEGTLTELTKVSASTNSYNGKQSARLVEEVNKTAFLRKFPTEHSFELCDPTKVGVEVPSTHIPLATEKVAEDFQAGMFKVASKGSNYAKFRTVDKIASIMPEDLIGFKNPAESVKTASETIKARTIRDAMREKYASDQASSNAQLKEEYFQYKVDENFDQFLSHYKTAGYGWGKEASQVLGDLLTTFPDDGLLVTQLIKRANDRLLAELPDKWFVKESSLELKSATEYNHLLPSNPLRTSVENISSLLKEYKTT